MTPDQRRRRFRDLHAGPDLFVLPNPWDVASARILERQDFAALATTSSGFAWSLGHVDGDLDLAALVDHVAAIVAAVDIPVSVDAERCFADTPDGVAGTVDALAVAGAAGLSIEDWNPATRSIDAFETSLARVQAAVDAASPHGMVVTARAEGLLRGVGDLDDVVRRLTAFGEAGADCVYAPAVRDAVDIARLVDLGLPVNVLLMPGVPSLAELADLGVRRVSTGGGLARAAYGALIQAGEELLAGTTTFVASALPSQQITPLVAR